MYDNIGDKLQGLAIFTFVVETLGFIITGFVLLGNDYEAGFLFLFCGPLVALVSSWILYAFGQLVEDVHAIRTNDTTGKSTKQMPNGTIVRSKGEERNRATQLLKKAAVASSNTAAKRCPYCGEIAKSDKCDMCGKEIKF